MGIQAHLLTGLRLALALPLAIAFARPDLLSAGLVGVLLIVALSSDYFDGIAARRYGIASAGGQLFDHATDCVFVTACLTGAALAGQVPLVLPVLIAVAFSQYVLDSYWLHRRKQLRMSTIGRWNGIGYFVPLVVLAAARLELVPAVTPLLTALARVIAYVLVASTLVSIVDRATAARREIGR
jgi:phosphatidylglycerophosphate synthase